MYKLVHQEILKVETRQMSHGDKHGLLKFFNVIESKNKQREFVDSSTPRSRPQSRLPRNNTNSQSFSPSPSTKRKRRLTELDKPTSYKKPNMSSTPSSSSTTDPTPSDVTKKKKLTPDLQALKDEMQQDMLNIIAPLQASIKDLIEGLKECQLLKIENRELLSRVRKVETDNKNLCAKVQHLEDKLLEGNIIFQGIPESLWEPSSTTKEKVLTAIANTISGNGHEDKMNQARNIPIKDVTRLGKYTALRNRPVLVEFCYKSDAEFLLMNRKELPQGVFVDKQYSEDTERERRKLRPILRAARNHENYKGKCKMEGAKLVIKGRNYDSSNLHTLPSEINGYSATSKSNDNVIGFFGELSPLSNFHPTNFTINGIGYHSAEQFIQHQKCKLFNDMESEQRILESTTAFECKMIARDIRNYERERWKQNAKASCTPGILAKFEQNPILSKLLTSTGDKTLVECCKDADWGTGIPLYADNPLDNSNWQSQGLLGEILESVRLILHEPKLPTANNMET